MKDDAITLKLFLKFKIAKSVHFAKIQPHDFSNKIFLVKIYLVEIVRYEIMATSQYEGTISNKQDKVFYHKSDVISVYC